MLLRLYDITEPSINPAYLLGSVSTAALATGGGQVLVASGTTAPGLSGPTIEPIYRVVSDVTTATPAKAGSLLVQTFVSTNSGGAMFTIGPSVAISSTGSAYPRFSYGIVISPPATFAGPATAAVQQNVGGQSMICVEGMANALISTTVAVTQGMALINGLTTGSLQNGTAVIIPGGVLAIMMASTSGGTVTAALNLVKVGGY